MKKAMYPLVLIFVSCIFIFSCSDDDPLGPQTAPAVTGSLLGLDSDHQNLYQQFDSLVTYYPNYQIAVDTSLVTFAVEVADSSKDWYDISISSRKLARAIITPNSVAITGYYRAVDEHDSLFYFIHAPEIMPKKLRVDDSWNFYVPMIHHDGRETIVSYLNFGFGYDVTRTYLGQEDIARPAGPFSAHKIRSEYRLIGSDEIVKTDTEYLVDGIGLVRMYSRGNFGNSHILLISSDHPKY